MPIRLTTRRLGRRALQRVLEEEVAVSPEVAADVLRIGRSSTYKAIGAGEIPHFRIGRLIKVPTAWLRRPGPRSGSV
jgi:excisionase family DNA binding protein